jgi:hypothetical protein
VWKNRLRLALSNGPNKVASPIYPCSSRRQRRIQPPERCGVP